jgi:diaminopimelate decarboxylase
MRAELDLFPTGAHIDAAGRLWLSEVSVEALAEEFGTPLYVFDEETIRGRCHAYIRALEQYYPAAAELAYASKAYLNTALAQLFAQEGLSLDVVSGGELHVALHAGFPPDRIRFHGNNKSLLELAQGLEAGIGCFVLDNFLELETLECLAAEQGKRVLTWLRLSPGVDVHTHEYRKTGLLDSKFGFTIQTGQAEQALVRAINSSHLQLSGVHAHIGSQIFEAAPFVAAVDALLDFVASMRMGYGFDMREISPGGGWGVPYHPEDPAPALETYVSTVCQAVINGCQRHGLTLPRLVLEPGRSIIARAGVALYRVGARKEIPGVRTYLSVDGGMADNIRPALYGARYMALAATRADAPPEEEVTIAGRFCESGDVLVRDLRLPRMTAGDLLAVPGVGAYCLPLASNYNLATRPAVVMVRDGQASLIQRRETHSDLVARDLPLPGPPLTSEGRRFAHGDPQ